MTLKPQIASTLLTETSRIETGRADVYTRIGNARRAVFISHQSGAPVEKAVAADSWNQHQAGMIEYQLSTNGHSTPFHETEVAS